MTDIQRLELGEHQTRTWPTDALPSAADERLAHRLAGDGNEPARLDVRWLANGHVEVSATSWIGVVRFSGIEVHVFPKLVGGNLRVLRMLEYALGVRMLRRLPAQRPLAAEGDDLLDLVCLLLVEETQAVLRDGLLRDYREAEDDLSALRGRLRYRDQYFRRFGQLDRLECRYDEYDSNTPDNQLLAVALDAARRIAKERDIRFSALRLGGLLREACEPPSGDVEWYERAIHYSRRNSRYRSAHELAKLVLRNLAFHDMFNTTSGAVTAFMINMNTVFERFVLRLVGEALGGVSRIDALPHQRLRAVIRNDDTGRTYTSIDPDLVIADKEADERVPIDVKYKLYDTKKLAPADIYQTFMYAFALGKGGTQRAGVIFPASSTVSGPTLSIRPVAAVSTTAAKIMAAGLDVPRALDDLDGPARSGLLADVRSLVEHLTGFTATAISA